MIFVFNGILINSDNLSLSKIKNKKDNDVK